MSNWKEIVETMGGAASGGTAETWYPSGLVVADGEIHVLASIDQPSYGASGPLGVQVFDATTYAHLRTVALQRNGSALHGAAHALYLHAGHYYTVCLDDNGAADEPYVPMVFDATSGLCTQVITCPDTVYLTSGNISHSAQGLAVDADGLVYVLYQHLKFIVIFNASFTQIDAWDIDTLAHDWPFNSAHQLDSTRVCDLYIDPIQEHLYLTINWTSGARDVKCFTLEGDPVHVWTTHPEDYLGVHNDWYQKYTSCMSWLAAGQEFGYIAGVGCDADGQRWLFCGNADYYGEASYASFIPLQWLYAFDAQAAYLGYVDVWDANRGTQDGAAPPTYRVSTVAAARLDADRIAFTNGCVCVADTDGHGAYTFVSNVAVLATDVATTADPTFTPPSGVYTGTCTVTLSCATPDAVIVYRAYLDGGAVGAWVPYDAEAGIVLAGPDPPTSPNMWMVEAVATGPEMDPSNIVLAAYTVTGTVATPTITPGTSTHVASVTATLACTTPDVVIYYTTAPTQVTPTQTYPGATVTLTATTTLTAWATRAGWADSATASATYTITPDDTPPPDDVLAAALVPVDFDQDGLAIVVMPTTDGEGAVSFVLDWGDVVVTAPQDAALLETEYTHTYADPGVYTITLTVTFATGTAQDTQYLALEAALAPVTMRLLESVPAEAAPGYSTTLPTAHQVPCRFRHRGPKERLKWNTFLTAQEVDLARTLTYTAQLEDQLIYYLAVLMEEGDGVQAQPRAVAARLARLWSERVLDDQRLV